MGRYVFYKRLENLIGDEKIHGRKIVLTGGCFDIIHKGHIYLLRKAKEFGDVLVVNVVNDERVRAYKGEGRPINTASQRAGVVSGFEFVDYVTVHPSVEKGSTIELALLIKPDIIVQSEGKWKRGDKKRLSNFLGYDVELRTVKKRRFNISTTKIIKKITERYSDRIPT